MAIGQLAGGRLSLFTTMVFYTAFLVMKGLTFQQMNRAVDPSSWNSLVLPCSLQL